MGWNTKASLRKVREYRVAGIALRMDCGASGRIVRAGLLEASRDQVDGNPEQHDERAGNQVPEQSIVHPFTFATGNALRAIVGAVPANILIPFQVF